MAFGRRNATAPSENPLPLAASVSAEAQLAALLRERDGLRSALEQIPDREQELIRADADDAAFEALDAETRNLRRQLARLGFREQELLAQARELHAAARRERWTALVASYAEAVERFISTTREADRLRREVETLSHQAARENFVFAGQSCLPPPPPPVDTSWFEQSAAAAAGRTPPTPAAQPQVYSLRFVRGWDRFNEGETAGFAPRQGHQLVDMGVAAWTGTPPPRPEGDTPREPRRVLSRLLP